MWTRLVVRWVSHNVSQRLLHKIPRNIFTVCGTKYRTHTKNLKKKFSDFFPDMDTNFPDYFPHFALPDIFNIHLKKRISNLNIFQMTIIFFNFTIINIKKGSLTFSDLFEKQKSPWLSLTTSIFKVFPDCLVRWEHWMVTLRRVYPQDLDWMCF